jgi:hypothetical protein
MVVSVAVSPVSPSVSLNMASMDVNTTSNPRKDFPHGLEKRGCSR